MTAPTTTTTTTTTTAYRKVKAEVKAKDEIAFEKEVDKVLAQPVVVEAAYPNLVSIINQTNLLAICSQNGYEWSSNWIKSNQIESYIFSQRLVAVDKGRLLIQAQIVADVMDGNFWVGGYSWGSGDWLVGSKALSGMVPVAVIRDDRSAAMASEKWGWGWRWGWRWSPTEEKSTPTGCY